MKIGITGVSGFIGKSIAEALSQEAHQVVPLDRFTRSINSCYKETNSYSNNLDWVLHFGAKTSISDSFSDPFTTYANNVGATIKALEIAYKSRAVFMYMNSYVYGPPQYMPIDEKHPVMPLNPYSGSKIASEQVCRHLSDTLKIPLVILRGFNIYGRCRIPGRLISDILESSDKREPLYLNDPFPRRDYLYIKDFQELIFKIISQKPVSTGTFNVGYGQSYSNQEVVEMAKILSGNCFEVIIQSKPRPMDISDNIADISLVKKTFSWTPAYSLERGLKELILYNL